MLKIFVVLGFVFSSFVCAPGGEDQIQETVSIIPVPRSVVKQAGRFRANTRTCLISDAELGGIARYLRKTLSTATGFNFSAANTVRDNCIVLKYDRSLEAEAYQLLVNSAGIEIRAATEAGAFYGGQTLRQLFDPAIFARQIRNNVDWVIPGLVVQDQPRFAWRGMHLDVSRHYMPVTFIKKFLDAMALHKMNRFHWHLTDDQGWRIEIKKYPALTGIGAWRKETVVGERDSGEYDGKVHGGYYSQTQIRDIVAYAKSLHIVVIPEIEMPGHAQAAIAAYPKLGNLDESLEVWTTWGINENIFNAEEETILFLQDVLLEVMDLFPGEFIHIGGDEAIKTQWEQSPKIQAKIKELGLSDERQLQSWFVGRMATFLKERGRRLIGWDEILQGSPDRPGRQTVGGLTEDAAVMAWRGERFSARAARAGHDVVIADFGGTYFDKYQAGRENEPSAQPFFLLLEDVYEFDIMPAGLNEAEKRRVLGGQGQLWTEYISTPKHLEYMAFPRLCAMSEILWSLPENKNYDDFLSRLDSHNKRLDELGINYRPPGNDELSVAESLEKFGMRIVAWFYFWRQG